MTPREVEAYNTGIRAVLDMATIAAVTIETRDDSQGIRQRAAAAALQGLAEGAKSLLVGAEPEPDPVHRAFAIIAGEPGTAGTIPCPQCVGRLNWGRDSENGHVWGECETTGCLRWIQ